jgi:YHS domain-containing protein
MRILRHVGLAAAAAMAQGALAQDAGAPGPERDTLVLVAAAGEGTFAPGQARGRTVIVHLLTAADSEKGDAFVRACLGRACHLAGVTQVFVRPGSAEATRAWAERFGEGAASVFIDEGGDARRLLLGDEAAPAGAPGPAHAVTIVLDPDGREVIRVEGSAADEHPDVGVLLARVERARSRAAISDYNLPRGEPLGVEGYDVVAYHALGRAVRGRAALASTYRGVTYQFSAERHREMFCADPERYEPAYGGWCASAMGAKGTKVGIDPANFKIKDGRLLLFYRSRFSDALRDWNQHEAEWEPAADANWKRLTREEARRFPEPAKPERGG